MVHGSRFTGGVFICRRCLWPRQGHVIVTTFAGYWQHEVIQKDERSSSDCGNRKNGKSSTDPMTFEGIFAKIEV
jgi:hypothetical protein